VASEIDRDLARLEAALKQLEAEYSTYFSGGSKKPPWEARSRVEALVRQYDRAYIQNTGDRFRFTTIQSRFAAFVDLWDRGLRAREEGRAGPFPQKKAGAGAVPKGPEDRVLRVTAFTDPVREMDKLTELYESLAEAQREAGQTNVPFHKFADLVKGQVNKLRESGSPEVAFRVAVKDGKVSFTAKAMKGAKE
jgi:hypothetical protein